jgi:SRSO17 transposase
MAARLEPERVQATHQSLHHLVAKAEWSDEVMLTAVRSQVLPAIDQHGAINAWIVDDTGYPKKGTQSVGVALQYCGQLGLCQCRLKSGWPENSDGGPRGDRCWPVMMAMQQLEVEA